MLYCTFKKPYNLDTFTVKCIDLYALVLIVLVAIKNQKFEEAFIIKVLEFIENKNLRVVPTSPKIASFVRRNRRYKKLLPVGIKL